MTDNPVISPRHPENTDKTFTDRLLEIPAPWEAPAVYDLMADADKVKEERDTHRREMVKQIGYKMDALRANDELAAERDALKAAAREFIDAELEWRQQPSGRQDDVRFCTALDALELLLPKDEASDE